MQQSAGPVAAPSARRRLLAAPLAALCVALALSACGRPAAQEVAAPSPGASENAEPAAPGTGRLKVRTVYDFVGDRAGTQWASFELNGDYDYPEPIYGGWPVRVTPVDAGGAPTGEAIETTTLQELSPTDGRYLSLPAGRYRVEAGLPTATPGGVWTVTGANSSAAGATAAAGVTSAVTVEVAAGTGETVARFFTACRVDGSVPAFPGGALEDVAAPEWPCRPSFAAQAPGSGLTPIAAVQGAGAASPLVGSAVTVEGVVVGDFQGAGGLNGFFVQDPSGDGDPATAEGLFVFVPAANPFSSVAVKPGDRVRVGGTVREFASGGASQTQLDSVTELAVLGSGATVLPATLDLPVAATTDLERFENTLVRLPETLTVSETFGLGRFGELILSSDGRQFSPTNGQGDTPDTIARGRLTLDDGRSGQNPSPTPYLGGAGSAATRRVGDTVANLTGVLTYAFSAYRLQPTLEPTFAAANPRTPAPRNVGGLKVASFNVLNYFTTLGPAGRGASDAAEFERQRTKIVAAIKAMDADVVGLIEIENNGPAATGNLVAALNAAYGGPTYAAVADPATGTGSDAIKVAFLYKPGRVSLVGPARSVNEPTYERAPVAQTFSAGGETFTAIVNHFKSKSGCPASGDVDTGQGCFNLRRTEQANRLLAFVASLQTETGDPDVLVIGDLNAYLEEDPIRALEAGGLANLSLRVPLAERYTYVFQGQSGSLDHALATSSLAAQVRDLTLWHVNADEPPVLDYNTEFKPDDRYSPTPYRSSDHDPVIVGLELR